jgi:hypothetical protein
MVLTLPQGLDLSLFLPLCRVDYVKVLGIGERWAKVGPKLYMDQSTRSKAFVYKSSNTPGH